MLAEGATIIDIGAVSTRPGAQPVCEYGEIDRLFPSLRAVRHAFPDCLISVDTTRAEVARAAMEYGADIINDISGGYSDPLMFPLVSELDIPYVLMHMRGTPETMQHDPRYDDVVGEVNAWFDERLQAMGTSAPGRIILDPGFGFGKTVRHNYEMLQSLERFRRPGIPLMAGLSRKSMIWKVLGTTPEHALNGTTVLHAVALLKGIQILRVHDVKEAVEVIQLIAELPAAKNDETCFTDQGI